jgi:hypothetical protein
MSLARSVCSTVPWYDAKLWQFVQQRGEAGDFIWNVATVPEDVEAAAREVLRGLEGRGSRLARDHGPGPA